MERLPSILFQMSAGNADGFFRAIGQGNDKFASADNGLFELTDLIPFGGVGIKIVFAIEHRATTYFSANTKPK